MFVRSQALGSRSTLSEMRSAHTGQWCLEGADHQAPTLPKPFQRLIYMFTMQDHAFHSLQTVKDWCSSPQHTIVLRDRWLSWHSSRFPEAICTSCNISETVACPGR